MDESSDRHAHAGKHLHMGTATRFVMFTAGGTDAYGCTSKGQQGLVFIILNEKNSFSRYVQGTITHACWTS